MALTELGKYSFDDECSSASFYDFVNKKIQIHFTAYYDLLLNERVETSCILVIEKWTEAKSQTTTSFVDVPTILLKDEYVTHRGAIVIEREGNSKNRITEVGSAIDEATIFLQDRYTNYPLSVMLEKITDQKTRINKTIKGKSIDCFMDIIDMIHVIEYEGDNLHLLVSTLCHGSLQLLFTSPIVSVIEK